VVSIRANLIQKATTMLQGISFAVGLASLLCYLFVIYKMFDNAESVMGIVCLVGVCVLGLGGLVAFVYGWMKAWEWEIVPVMGIWSGCIATQIILAVIQVMMGG
jgi:hypothetical protein